MRFPFDAGVLLLALAAGCASTPSGDDEPVRDAPPRPAPPLQSASTTADGGAAAKPAATKPPAEAAQPAPPSAIAGWIAGKPLSFEEVLVEWHRTAPREVFLIVEKLVASRIAFAEADRLGIKLRPDVVEAETMAQIARFKADVAKEAPGAEIDDYLRGALGIEPETQWQSLREGVVRQMIAERAVRAFALERENATVRLIVVQTEDKAKALADRIAAGEEFGAVARAESVDESAEQEGLVPFLVRQDTSPLARVVFAAAPGEVVGPLPAAGHQFLVKVEELRPAVVGGWPALERPVEDSLRRFPVQESEFLHWKLELERTHPVDLAPLLDRIGAAREPVDKPGSSKDKPTEKQGSAPTDP